MKEYQVPMKPVAVDVHLADGVHMQGRLFLTEAPGLSNGMSQLVHALNDERAFLPFEVGDDRSCRSIVLNKDQIICVHMNAEDMPGEDGEVNSLQRSGHTEDALVSVLHLSDGSQVCGEVMVDTPEASSRLVDKLNHAQRFIPVVRDDGIDVVHQGHVLTLD